MIFCTAQSVPLFLDIDSQVASQALIGIALIGSVSAAMQRSVWSRQFLFLSLVFTGLITLNFIYASPTLGALALLFILLTLDHSWNSQTQGSEAVPIADSVLKSNSLQSFIIISTALVLGSTRIASFDNLFYFSVLLGALSVLILHFYRSNFLRNGLLAVALMGGGAGLLGEERVLQYLSFLLFSLAFVSTAVIIFTKNAVSKFEELAFRIFDYPHFVVVGYFLLLALVGAVLLQAPWAHLKPYENSHALVDSLFTSMSAVSVTGLNVIDTATSYSLLGQFIILILIQLGGLGITSLSVWILAILSTGRLSLSHEDVLNDMSGHSSQFKVGDLLKRIFSYFFVFESIGASLLTLLFWQAGDSFPMAVWRGIFTSVSAFCNAGFALQTDNLITYQHNGFILLVVSFLIIGGGFAPLMVLDWPQKLRHKRWSLQDRLALLTTGSLLVGGLAFILLVEWDNSLSHLSVLEKIANAWFQSVTTRTAGFNSIDLADMHGVTQIFFLFLMFVGGNPGSTAGGIKTVTLAVLLVAAMSGLRGESEPRAFNRRISEGKVYQAILITFFGIAVHFVSFFLLSVTQNLGAKELMFEVFSAFGTVGLSIGATTRLDEVGKIIIIICMLAGRVGPLTFLFLLIRKSKKKSWKVITEDVSIA